MNIQTDKAVDNTEPSRIGNDSKGVTTRLSLRNFVEKFYDDNDRLYWVTNAKSAAVPKKNWKSFVKNLNSLYQYCYNDEKNKYNGVPRMIKELNLNVNAINFRWWLCEIGIELQGQDRVFTSKERARKIGETVSRIRNTTPEVYENSGRRISETKAKWSKERRNEIFKNPIRNKKISIGRKIFLAKNIEFKNSMVEKFINAPKHTRNKPNLPEKNVLSFRLPGVCFVGNGKYFLTLTCDNGEHWHKNPDFICKEWEGQRRVRAVIEIMDFEYWHTKEEGILLKRLYENLGIMCLVVDASRCYDENDLLAVKKEIIQFLSEHEIVWSELKNSELGLVDPTTSCLNKND